MNRRTFLAVSASALQARERVRREVFLRSPGPGTAVMCCAYYTKASGGAMMSIEHRFSRSDTVDHDAAAALFGQVPLCTFGSAERCGR